MTKALLLGAGGFVGSHLTIELLRTGEYHITALDLTRDKLDEGLGLASDVIDGCPEEPAEAAAARRAEVTAGLEFVFLDIMDPANDSTLRDLVANHDVVVNLVAICNPALYVSDPIRTFEIGFLGNLKVVEMCRQAGKRLIQYSTSEVYGKSPARYAPGQDFVFDEETSDLILGPINKHRWIYASSKQLLERVIHAYGIKEGFSYSIIRPFNYIGEMIDYLPSEKEGNPRVFSNFMDALLNGTPMKLVDGGTQRRCYTYIADATDAHVRIIRQADRCDRQIFNVGLSENETTIRNLAETMRDIYDREFRADGEALSEIVEIPGEAFYGEGYEDCDRRLLHNGKLRTLTGWAPRYDLRTMLERIMRYHVVKRRITSGEAQSHAFVS